MVGEEPCLLASRRRFLLRSREPIPAHVKDGACVAGEVEPVGYLKEPAGREVQKDAVREGWGMGCGSLIGRYIWSSYHWSSIR